MDEAAWRARFKAAGLSGKDIDNAMVFTTMTRDELEREYERNLTAVIKSGEAFMRAFEDAYGLPWRFRLYRWLRKRVLGR